ncbi:MAG: hypothetical protein Q8922_01650 [Bacteroidota bacterium]|nr:hypothetical protein [Bacteroidota bacterium]MDP4232068.1 hypothetical protein [Bacteroidota bacterium]MDP4241225.1 hypothetical protein [Bacteroidota bacterium]MDP4286617.1 hypothetical protein [Bacteroidota bacterium]
MRVLLTTVLVAMLVAVAGGLRAQSCFPIKITGPHPRLIATLNAGQAQVMMTPGAKGGMDNYTSCGKNGGANPNSVIAKIRFKRGVNYNVCVQGAPDCLSAWMNIDRAPGWTPTKLMFKDKGVSVSVQLYDCRTPTGEAKRKRK